jgi:hypothetical protein
MNKVKINKNYGGAPEKIVINYILFNFGELRNSLWLT